MCTFSMQWFCLGTQAMEAMNIFLSIGTQQEHLLLRKPALDLTENTKDR